MEKSTLPESMLSRFGQFPSELCPCNLAIRSGQISEITQSLKDRL